MRYFALPLADHGFVPTDAIRNPVRWYVEDSEKPSRLLGPYKDASTADDAAAHLNTSDRWKNERGA